MSKGLIKESTMSAIAEAIRVKTETTDSMIPSEMPKLIESIVTGFDVPALVGIDAGSFTAASISDGLPVYHNLGVAPDFVVMRCISPVDPSNRQVLLLHQYVAMEDCSVKTSSTSSTTNVANFHTLAFINPTGYYSGAVSRNDDTDLFTPDAEKFDLDGVYSQYITRGFTYEWVCGKFAR